MLSCPEAKGCLRKDSKLGVFVSTEMGILGPLSILGSGEDNFAFYSGPIMSECQIWKLQAVNFACRRPPEPFALPSSIPNNQLVNKVSPFSATALCGITCPVIYYFHIGQKNCFAWRALVYLVFLIRINDFTEEAMSWSRTRLFQ